MENVVLNYLNNLARTIRKLDKKNIINRILLSDKILTIARRKSIF